MARDTMSELINRVRSLIGDTAGATQQFTDQEVQDALDAFRTDVRYLQLLASPTYNGSTVQYLEYYTDQSLGDWEDDFTLWQYRYLQVTAETAELVAGHWSFAETTLPPIFLNGKTYDVYRAAAQLLERWAAVLARNYDFNTGNNRFMRSQATKALLDMAATYRRRGRIRTAKLTRPDITEDDQPNGPGAQEIDYIASGDGR